MATVMYRQRENIVTREIAGETLLVPISGDLADMQRVFTLNETGVVVWSSLDGRTGLDEVCDRLTGAFEVDPQEAAADVRELVAALCAARLIEEVT